MEELLKQLREKLQTQLQSEERLASHIRSEQIKIRKMLNIYVDSDPFSPYYPPNKTISPDYPEVFSERGDRMRFFFLSDRDFAHDPYYSCERFIFWDRYNYGLKNHVYSGEEIFRPTGSPKHKFSMIVESRAIKPWVYDEILQNKDWVEREFDLVFTFDSEILDTLENARFVPFCAGYWFDKKLTAGDQQVKLPPDDIFSRKTKLISIIASDKTMCDLHEFRTKLALKCKHENLADTFGTFDGGEFVRFDIPLLDYRYSIVIENDVKLYWFSEKLTNCFASQTIPIYIGATEIGKFFNTDGIITIRVEDFDRLGEILKKCTIEEYNRRLPAILDNFQRVQEFKNPFDWMFEKYLQKYFD